MMRSFFALLIVMVPWFRQTSPTPRPSFEVASIKPYDRAVAGSPFVGFRVQTGGRLIATRVTLKMLMAFAYRVPDFQILEGPNWIDTDEWEVVAKAEDGAVPRESQAPDPNVPDTVALMVQSLLDERFQVRLHRQSRNLPILRLAVAKDGPKIQLSE